ncbi:MAG: hypothetical protein GY757_18540, partial [bacterium]|nr:hypothetical protein [bacterium]
VLLSWTTSSELNNLGLGILKSITPDTGYSMLASYKNRKELKGRINSSTRTDYEYKDIFVVNGATQYYKLVDVDINGVKTEHGPVSAIPNTAGSELVKDGTYMPDEYQLYQNYPNPFNLETTVRFSVPHRDEAALISIAVFSGSGQKVKTLFSGRIAGGVYELKWDGQNEGGTPSPSGLYYLYMKSNTFIKIGK